MFTPARCESTQGLFDRVVALMIRKQEELSEEQSRYKPKNLYKLIRTMVIEDADAIQQKPSLSLLLVLMDLVDMEGGNDFESIASVDKAGVKHVLLAYRNYMSFYIPKKELMCTTGKKVVPVVTQYSEKHHFFHCDKPRSMVGTYVVSLPATRTGEEDCYFVQDLRA
ncbi:hypothetical protein D5F01_LYC20801 [Larimichthys crocea]|uniref:Uncharacterized protein n=1 Tax=Larimichthys crocea TaxID=215358 RepID=A0A6G0HMF8_LARCR|nr:hypothetical protein D5F01_LYC20801 [Larimichthys crocea]